MTLLDAASFAWFLVAWIGYSAIVDRTRVGDRGLSAAMNRYREQWMEVLLTRRGRIVDTSIMVGLQNGTAFQASTALLATGAALALLNATDQALTITAGLGVGLAITRAQWEMRCFGLVVIFVYAFFKFAWSLRLFNYASILIGAVPESGEDPEGIAQRASRMTSMAGRHFSRGQRAFFFALAFLGSFVSPWVFIATTTVVVVVLARRQFFSDALDSLES